MKASETKPWLKYYTEESLAKTYVERTITDYLLWRNSDRMDMTALNYFDHEISLGELFEHTYETANAFASLGIKENDIVLVCSAATPEIVYTFYGLSLLGAASYMLDPRYSVKGIRDVITEVDARIVLTLDVAYDKMIEAIKGTNVEKVIVLSPADSLVGIKKFAYLKFKNPRKKNLPANFCHWSEFIAAGKDYKTEYLHDCADHCVVIVRTGGTTGVSKSVMLSHNNINNVSFQFHKRSSAEAGKDKFLDVMPPFIAYGLGYGVHLPLACAMTSVLIPQLEPEKMAGLILKYKPQQIAATPGVMKILVRDKRLKNADLSFFKNICCGGDAMPVPDEERINDFFRAHNAKHDLAKGYGLSEVSAVSTACLDGVSKVGSVGVPLPDYNIAAFDPETGEETEIGEIGEICIHGPTTMIGYYKMPEETAHVLRTHKDGLVWVHTGDLGLVDEDGFIFIKGRIKRMFMDHIGFKIFPSAIEDILSRCEDVFAVSVVGTTDHRYLQGSTPHVFVVLTPECTRSKEEVEKELRALCEKELAEYMQPSFYTFLDALPQTPIGKVDFRKLEAQAEAEHSEEQAVASEV